MVPLLWATLIMATCRLLFHLALRPLLECPTHTVNQIPLDCALPQVSLLYLLGERRLVHSTRHRLVVLEVPTLRTAIR
jgi:hypothetical protein